MQEILKVADQEEARALLGTHDVVLKKLRDDFDLSVWARDTEIHLSGDPEPVSDGMRVLENLKLILVESGRITPDDIDNAFADVRRETPEYARHRIEVLVPGRHVRPRSSGQLRYVRTIEEHDLVFCKGPAGTGKTYLAVALAANYLRMRRVKRICLVRPAVEAGEKLGYLPGDIAAKVNPYLRPVYDALNEMLEFGNLKKYMENDIIEVAPLAYMRGRTLNDSFIILDEAQNTTIGQMKMFLTRLGMRSKFVVTGDTSQVDLPAGQTSGLIDAEGLLAEVDGVAFVTLTARDIVRHSLVQRIVNAYDARDAKTRRARPARREKSAPRRED
ncbi:MAG: PhoH family protein [Planctomycetota bacterium]